MQDMLYTAGRIYRKSVHIRGTPKMADAYDPHKARYADWQEALRAVRNIQILQGKIDASDVEKTQAKEYWEKIAEDRKQVQSETLHRKHALRL